MNAPVSIAANAGPIREVGSPWRWLAQPMTSGFIQGEHRPAWVLPEFAAAMIGRPVRWVVEAGELVHPSWREDPQNPAHRVGEIEASWVVGDQWRAAVRAIIRLDADAARFQAALLRMHADGHLRVGLGLSIFARVERDTDASGASYVVAVKEFIALDFGTTPGNRNARLIRPLRPGEDPNPRTKESQP